MSDSYSGSGLKKYGFKPTTFNDLFDYFADAVKQRKLKDELNSQQIRLLEDLVGPTSRCSNSGICKVNVGTFIQKIGEEYKKVGCDFRQISDESKKELFGTISLFAATCAADLKSKGGAVKHSKRISGCCNAQMICDSIKALNLGTPYIGQDFKIIDRYGVVDLIFKPGLRVLEKGGLISQTDVAAMLR